MLRRHFFTISLGRHFRIRINGLLLILIFFAILLSNTIFFWSLHGLFSKTIPEREKRGLHWDECMKRLDDFNDDLEKKVVSEEPKRSFKELSKECDMFHVWVGKFTTPLPLGILRHNARMVSPRKICLISAMNNVHKLKIDGVVNVKADLDEIVREVGRENFFKPHGEDTKGTRNFFVHHADFLRIYYMKRLKLPYLDLDALIINPDFLDYKRRYVTYSCELFPMKNATTKEYYLGIAYFSLGGTKLLDDYEERMLGKVLDPNDFLSIGGLITEVFYENKEMYVKELDIICQEEFSCLNAVIGDRQENTQENVVWALQKCKLVHFHGHEFNNQFKKRFYETSWGGLFEYYGMGLNDCHKCFS